MRFASFCLGADPCVCCGCSTVSGLCGACRQRLTVNHPCCDICAVPMSAGGICGICQRKPPPYTKVYAPFRYEYPADELISRFKHQADFAAGRVLLGLLVAHLQAADIPSPDILAPLPLHWRRQWRRGFNQTVWLAVRLARQLGCHCDIRILRRSRYVVPQQQLSRRQRQRNIRESFACRTDLTGRRVVLLDDVVTTGATVAEASRCLKKAGAEAVEIWCLARTPLIR